MNNTLYQFLPLLPEIFMLAMLSLILLIDAAVGDDKRYIAYGLSLATLAGTAYLTLRDFSTMPALAMNGLFVDDPLSDVLKLFLYLTVAAVMVYSRNYLRQRGLFKGEFFVLALFATLGMMVMVSANDLMALYVGLELLSLSLYVVAAFNRDSERSAEAGL